MWRSRDLSYKDKILLSIWDVGTFSWAKLGKFVLTKIDLFFADVGKYLIKVCVFWARVKNLQNTINILGKIQASYSTNKAIPVDIFFIILSEQIPIFLTNLCKSIPLICNISPVEIECIFKSLPLHIKWHTQLFQQEI